MDHGNEVTCVKPCFRDQRPRPQKLACTSMFWYNLYRKAEQSNGIFLNRCKINKPHFYSETKNHGAMSNLMPDNIFPSHLIGSQLPKKALIGSELEYVMLSKYNTTDDKAYIMPVHFVSRVLSQWQAVSLHLVYMSCKAF